MMENETASRPTSKLQHRADIDGLRALAVLPVVAYHVGIRAIPGGFIGVDVFFVISGYLITLVLLQDLNRGRFSLTNFYERRVRRIAPALFAVLIATLPICFIYSLPSEFVDYAKSLIAATISASNFYFWHTTSYFGAPALAKPLLHTWSLAVEEQFYIFWPVCLWLGFRFARRRLLPTVIAVAALSFAASAVGAFLYPTATFYLVTSRAWELLLGAFLALGLCPSKLGAFARNGLALCGVALITGSALLITNSMPFPGLLAAPACLGAFLVILGGRDGSSVVARALGSRPIAFIGLISYSLYLWHWPLVVFQRDYGLLLIPGAPARDQKLLVVACSFLLAALSWKYVEQPFRIGMRRPSRRALFRVAATAASLMTCCGVSTLAAHGFPRRFSAHELKIASYLEDSQWAFLRADSCFYESDQYHGSIHRRCLEGVPGKKNFLLLGDSIAADFAYGLRAAYPGIHFLEVTAIGCFPLLNHGWKELPYCAQILDLKKLTAGGHIDGVVLAARWEADNVPAVAETIAWLHQRGIPVTLIGPTLIFDSPLPQLMLTAARMSEPHLAREHQDHNLWRIDNQLAGVARENRAQYVSVLSTLCPREKCEMADADGMPLLFDEDHLTAEGSLMLARDLKAEGLWEDQKSATAATL